MLPSHLSAFPASIDRWRFARVSHARSPPKPESKRPSVGLVAGSQRSRYARAAGAATTPPESPRSASAAPSHRFPTEQLPRSPRACPCTSGPQDDSGGIGRRPLPLCVARAAATISLCTPARRGRRYQTGGWASQCARRPSHRQHRGIRPSAARRARCGARPRRAWPAASESTAPERDRPGA